MPKIDIRPYAHDDRDTLISIFRNAVRIIARRDYSEAQVMAWAPDDIDAAEFGRRRTAKPTLVAEISGAPAGFTDLAPHGHIDMLFVDPVHRGQGVARALLETVEAMARAQGIARLTTDASITGKPIFERHGFTVVTGQTVTRNGQQLNNYRMEKTLD